MDKAETKVEQKKIGIFKKTFHYIFITRILQPVFNFYWCDKCNRLTRYDYQITIQPSMDGNKVKMKIPYCTRCVALESSKKKQIVKTYRKKL